MTPRQITTMTTTAQRNAVVNFVANYGNTSLPDRWTPAQIATYIQADRDPAIQDPTRSRDAAHQALDLLGHGQRVAFPGFLARELGHGGPCRSGLVTLDTFQFDELHAAPEVLCSALLKLIGKWNPEL